MKEIYPYLITGIGMGFMCTPIIGLIGRLMFNKPFYIAGNIAFFITGLTLYYLNEYILHKNANNKKNRR